MNIKEFEKIPVSVLVSMPLIWLANKCDEAVAVKNVNACAHSVALMFTPQPPFCLPLSSPIINLLSPSRPERHLLSAVVEPLCSHYPNTSRGSLYSKYKTQTGGGMEEVS